MKALIEGIRDGAIAALEKRKAMKDKEYKKRNAHVLMAGKTPSDVDHHQETLGHYDQAIDDIKKMDL